MHGMFCKPSSVLPVEIPVSSSTRANAQYLTRVAERSPTKIEERRFSTWPNSLFSTRGDFPPEGYLAISEDICGCHTKGAGAIDI